MLATDLGVSHVLFSPGHLHQSTKVRSQDCSNHVLGLIMGAMEAAQILAWSSPHMYMLTKPTAAKARPVSAAAAFNHSAALQALSLQSQQWGV